MNLLHRWICRSDFWRKTVNEQIVPWTLQNVELGNEVLEVGPGPGLTTDLLRKTCPHLTALEVDPSAADALRRRLDQGNVTVVQGDGAAMPFPDKSFTGAVAFTMLHHVPSPALQDTLLREVRRVLRPGAYFAGSDSLGSFTLRLVHFGDSYVPINPDEFAPRLQSAGFADIEIESRHDRFRFRARRLD